MALYGWPFKGPFKVSCAFGKKGTAWKCGYHSGLDLVSIAAGGDGVVYPIADGIVLRTSYSSAYGVFVSVEHPDGYISLYAHLTSYLVREGQHINRNTVIGYEGSTGNATGMHLHLEVHKGEYVYPSTIDPALFIAERMEVKKVSTYCKIPVLYSVLIPNDQFKVIEWKKGKRTTAIKNYACFPFQASGTSVVGNIVIAGKAVHLDPRFSTIWTNYDGTVSFGKVPSGIARYAVSGFPLFANGKRYTLEEVLAEGWDTSPLYPTSHAVLYVDYKDKLHYLVFTTSKSGATASFEEIQNIVEQFNPKYALLGDGGGSTILDVGGSNMVASAGNRVLAFLIQF